MTMKLKNGDYVPDGAGGFLTVPGKEALLQRVLVKLTARRSAFPLLPNWGSRLYRLPQEKPSQRETLAKQYAEEALADEEGLEVREVQWDESGQMLTIYMIWQEEGLSVVWSL